MLSKIPKLADAGRTNCAPVTAPVNAVFSRPEFIRLPKTGTACSFTGLSRSTLNSLILPCAANGFKPPVRSYALRAHGRLKGIRLIDYESLCSFIREHANGFEQPQKQENLIPFPNAS
jgi:hypothetical protein